MSTNSVGIAPAIFSPNGPEQIIATAQTTPSILAGRQTSWIA